VPESESDPNTPDARWPRRVYGVGTEPDPRFSFAYERTFLAWIRTALGFVASGVAVAAVAKLNDSLGPEVRVAAIVLIVCGLVSGITALLQWMRNERAIRLNRPLPSSPLLPFLTAAIILVALVAVVVVSLQ
jgi:putative membrane protein